MVQQTLEKVERWPIIDKWDFLYSIQKHKPFDRTILQPILNFLRIRNGKIHPKPKEQPVISVVEEDELFSFETNQQELIINKEEGIKLGKEIFIFLDRLLLDICEVPPDDLSGLLSDYCQINHNTHYCLQKCGLYSVRIKIEELLNMKIRCLSFITPEKNRSTIKKFIDDMTKISTPQ